MRILCLICKFQKIHADIHASPIGNSDAEDTNAGEGEKDVGEEELFAVSPKKTRATPLTPSAQVKFTKKCVMF